MNATPAPPRGGPTGISERARELAQRLHERIDAPLTAAIGPIEIQALAADSHLAAQVHQAFRELSPNNWHRYNQAARKYERFWRDAVRGAVPYPQEIELHPSAYCPLDFWYCCSPHSYAREKISPHARNARLLAYARQLAETLETVQLSGGREPLEDATLPNFLEALQGRGVSFRLNTSGFSSKAGRLAALAPYLDYTAVSIDGHTAEMYNAIKQISEVGALQQVIENVRLAVAHPQRKGRMEMVVLVLPENREFLQQLAVFAHELGFDSVRFRRLKHHVIGGSATQENAFPGSTDPALLRHLYEIRSNLDFFEVNINAEDFLTNYDEYVRNNGSPCYSSSRKIVIDALGNVYPCALHSYPDAHGRGISLGKPINIKDYDTFAELWDAHAHVVAHYHAKPCTDCYIADRYINNFITRLATDDRDGNIALAISLFSGAPDGHRPS